MGRIIPKKKDILLGYNDSLVDIYIGLAKTKGPGKHDN